MTCESGFYDKTKGGFKSEDTGEFLLFQNEYSKSLSQEENFNKLFTAIGVKFKFSAQVKDLEYLSGRSKNPTVSSELKPHLWSMGVMNEISLKSPIVQMNQNSCLRKLTKNCFPKSKFLLPLPI